MPHAEHFQNSMARCKHTAWSLYAVIGCAVLLLGCASHMIVNPDPPPRDPLGEPSYGFSQVCVLRPHTWAMARTELVRDNGQLVGATLGPSYFCYAAQPGAHRIELENRRTFIQLNLVAGQRVFVHHRLGLTRERLLVLNEDRAQEMLDRCEYSQLLDTAKIEVVTEAAARP